jgi:prepilin-type N-terminal cleavage/methylation domain-containing protein
MSQHNRSNRNGFTLLEMIVSVAMLATMTTASVVMVRTTYTAWNRHEDDHQQMRAAIGVLRHLVRQVRQGVAVTALSDDTDTSGNLTLLNSDGNTLVWDHNDSTNEVRFGVGSATDLLAKNIDEFTITGHKSNGNDKTTDIDLIHSVSCVVKYTVTRPAGNEQKTIKCQAWLRSW